MKYIVLFHKGSKNMCIEEVTKNVCKSCLLEKEVLVCAKHRFPICENYLSLHFTKSRKFNTLEEAREHLKVLEVTTNL